jgi:hypothetical protein
VCSVARRQPMRGSGNNSLTYGIEFPFLSELRLSSVLFGLSGD